MCKLVTVIKKNNENDDLIIKAIQAQEKVIKKEPHGIAALAINQKSNKIEVKKEMDDYDKVLDWAYSKIKSSKIVSIHSRQATSGTINKDNLHFFKADEYYLAHNGVVTKCSDKWSPMGSYKGGYYAESYYRGGSLFLSSKKGKEKEVGKNKMCDSYKFLTKIKKPIEEDDILNEMEKQDFYGVGVIVDSKRKRLYSFATRAIPMHTNLKDYTIAYSFEPINKVEEYKNFMGFSIKGGKEETIHFNREKTVEGIYRYDY